MYAYTYISLNIMMKVSFSPGRDRACRHCWISFLFDPPGKTLTVFVLRDPFDNT